MNSTQWVFEYLSYIEEQDKRYEEINALVDVIKSLMINLFGLNISPIEEVDEKTGVTRLRPPEEHEFTPLSALLASPEMLEAIMKKHDELQSQQTVEAQLEKEVEVLTAEDIDKQLGDIDFLEDTETLLKKHAWESPGAKNLRNLFVSPLEDQPSIDDLLGEPDERSKQQMKEAKRLPKPKLVID